MNRPPIREQAFEIALQGVEKRFPSGIMALAPVDLRVARGEFVAIVGPSGCGKSTLLRILAGLISPSGGRADRPAGMTSAFVFQEPALLPWKTVQANAELLMKLERRHEPKTRRREAGEALRLVGLDGFEHSYPHELSGGMRMRLSLARAIALRPDLLLLDEPLAAVDELTRDTLQDELAKLRRLAGFAAVLVTHSVQEAVYLADRIVVMTPRPGRILRIVDVPFTTPRDRDLRSRGDFVALCSRISALLRGSHGEEAS